MIYTYKCPAHGEISVPIRADQITCTYSDCYWTARRRFGFSFKKPMQEHLNPTTGQIVRTDQQFNTQLKRMSEEATIRTGIEHTFQPIDISQPQTFGVTEQGLDQQAKRRHDKGLPV